MTRAINTNHIPWNQAFAQPDSLYRGSPFWSWNGALDQDELIRQLDVFKEMGIGGVNIHCRTGLQTPYLSDEFMSIVKHCRDHAQSRGMLTWLYDEDRWPSGFAGGLVTVDPAFRQRSLLFTPTPYGQGTIRIHTDSTASASRTEKGRLLARYAITIENRALKNYRTLADNEQPRPGETCWYAYLEVAPDSPWFNNQSYVDSLNPRAIQRFIDVTYERYYQAVGDGFGKDIPAIFTDEPQFTHKRRLPASDSLRDVPLAWTDDLDEAFTRQFGQSILAHLPEVIWDLPDGRASVWRYRYHEWVAERFASSFADQIGSWCASHNVALTGHMMEESTLAKQTKALGEAMRSYRSMHIPGIDMLCDWEELNTAKQAQSAARQFDRPGTLSELYGVTGWHFDFQGHKRQGDWQAALGVLFRTHHLSWYCMRGEAKRDYPASISYQSPWYRKYPTIEDHFARLGAILSRGKAHCQVAVIHPVESFWLCFGPGDTSAAQCDQRDEHFASLTSWLLHGLIDFDFVAESLLPDQKPSTIKGRFGAGAMSYQVVIVPSMRTIRSTTLDRLEAFADAGGRVLFVGEIPSLVDALPSDHAALLARRCTHLGFDRVAILDALSDHRDIDLLTPAGVRPDNLLYQMRDESEDRFLFICHKTKKGLASGTLQIRGEYKVTSLDTATGHSTPIAATYANQQTRLDVRLHPADHLLLHLTPGKRTEGQSLIPSLGKEAARLSSPVPVTLDEPNVLLFDKAEFQINAGPWRSTTQLLDIENILRAELQLPHKDGSIAQPWTDLSPVQPLARLSLRIIFDARIAVAGAKLALENIGESTVRFDGRSLDMTPTGYFTDKAISTIALPDFAPGEHRIEIDLTFTRQTSVEWMYLLGDFGVTIRGDRGMIVEPVRELSFGNWTTQGLPFYGGNITYHCTCPADGSTVQLAQFDATAAEVRTAGQSAMVYRPPFTASLPLKAGAPLDITLYGHRGNCFGPIHLAEPMDWLGPHSYRTAGHRYCPEFQLKPLGIRTSPIIYT